MSRPWVKAETNQYVVFDFSLAPLDVHIWYADLDVDSGEIEQYAQLLAPEERVRAEKFFFARDRNRFLVAHGILREILGRYLDVEPRRIRFATSIYGKPTLAGPLEKKGITFNLSHCQNRVAYGLAMDRAIGVDIEKIHSFAEMCYIASRYFSATEKKNLERLPPAARPALFFKYWTIREALGKATGHGLNQAWDSVAVTMDSDGTARLIDLARNTGKAPPWSIRVLQPGRGFVGAVVVGGAIDRIRCTEWP